MTQGLIITTPTSAAASFDPVKNQQEIRDLELDVQRMERRLTDAGKVSNAHEEVYKETKAKYHAEKRKQEELVNQKDKVAS